MKKIFLQYTLLSGGLKVLSACADAQAGMYLCCLQAPVGRFCHDEAHILVHLR